MYQNCNLRFSLIFQIKQVLPISKVYFLYMTTHTLREGLYTLHFSDFGIKAKIPTLYLLILNSITKLNATLCHLVHSKYILGTFALIQLLLCYRFESLCERLN